MTTGIEEAQAIFIRLSLPACQALRRSSHYSGPPADFSLGVTVHNWLANNRYGRTVVSRQQLGRDNPFLVAQVW
ncbi:MAG: hypothetical protein KatS3mg110_0448 [Pirellulaceae bacterium]|nr:MAG: hypothetical protein KatS3mg110_0448 [Pirellulaceae bacterium]